MIQHQRGNPNWPLWLKTHCSTGEKISNAEAAARVTSSNWNIYSQHQPLEHNRVGNPRFAVYIFTYLYTYLHIFTYIYIFIYLHMYTYLHIYIYTYTYIYFHIFIYFQIFSDIHIYLHIFTCTNHRCTYIYIYLHMFTYISMFTYTYIYWHMRTYTFISLTSTFFSHMGTCSCWGILVQVALATYASHANLDASGVFPLPVPWRTFLDEGCVGFEHVSSQQVGIHN